MHSITDTPSSLESSILKSQEHHFVQAENHKENTERFCKGC